MKTMNVIKSLTLVISGLSLVFQIDGQSVLSESRHYKLEKLADGVYAAIHNNQGGYAICNAGIVDLGDKTIVIDPFMSPSAARDLKQDAEYLTGKTVSFVLNLDLHSDHNRGNQVFYPGADIISTPNARKYIETNFEQELEENKNSVPEELKEIQKQLLTASLSEKVELTLIEDLYKAIMESLPELKMTLPNITVSDTFIIYGSKRRLVVIPTGTGHTNGDMVTYLPDDNIIFMSDQLFVKCHPYFGDGDPESWEENLKKLIALNPEIAVPGHGSVGDINSLYAMIDYIETLTDLVKREIKAGGDENKVMNIPIPEKFSDYLLSNFYKINLRFLYRKLSLEKERL
ncbi:MAG TPA: MBL fold metallo-hydrolase [Bacteroidales bacterium]|jgi:glyoxylase-like metal-dependent hydrolase (beta-lactamase superfamily II)|nr:MBL fold metallo-hydrolase [Bacteroidales bacterium]